VNELVTVAEANSLIDRGCVLHIAGEEHALRQLHRGNWIGGTTPYILTRDGGVVERDKVFVSELPVNPRAITTHFIDIGRLPAISVEAPRNGFTIVIAPGMSEIHSIYSLTAASIPGIRDIPIMGWISGVHADDRMKVTAKVVNSMTAEVADDRVEFELGAEVESAILAPVTMALAVFKFDRFEWAVEKCTELGAASIVPILARRTDAHLAQTLGTWSKLLTEEEQREILSDFKQDYPTKP